MFRDTLLLLLLRVRIDWNTFRRKNLFSRIIMLSFAIIFSGGFGFISAFIGFASGSLVKRTAAPELEIVFPSIVITLEIMFLFLGSLSTALTGLFLTDDMTLLMTAPVNRKAIFLSKLGDGLKWNMYIILIVAFPALVTYGLSLAYNPLYYIFALAALLFTPLLPMGLSAVLVLIVARFAPPNRVREFLGLFTTLLGLSCGLFSQIPRTLFGGIGLGRNSNSTRLSVKDVIENSQTILAYPFPTFFAGKGLGAVGQQNWGTGLGNFTIFFILTVVFFSGCIWLADKFYSSGWVRMQSSGRAKRSGARKRTKATDWLNRASADMAIAWKDWISIPRDLRNFAVLAAPLPLITVFYINTLGPRAAFNDPGGAVNVFTSSPFGQHVFITASILMATSMMFIQLALMSISKEGASWWILKVAPITPTEILRGKLFFSVIPYAIASSLIYIIVGIWRQFSLVGLLYGWFGLESLGICLIAVSLGLSVPWTRLDWQNPKQMTSPWSTLISFFACAVLAILGGFLLLLPSIAKEVYPPFIAISWLIGIGGTLGLTILSSVLSFKLGVFYLAKLGEDPTRSI